MGRPPTGVGTPIQVRLQPSDLAALDRVIAETAADEATFSRPAAIRHILSDWLTDHGYLKHRDDPEEAN